MTEEEKVELQDHERWAQQLKDAEEMCFDLKSRYNKKTPAGKQVIQLSNSLMHMRFRLDETMATENPKIKRAILNTIYYKPPK